MNVKPGDLARVVEAVHPENMGRIVTVKQPCKCYPSSWEVNSPRGFKTVTFFGVRTENELCIHDRCLRKICPPPDEMIPDPVEIPVGDHEEVDS